MTYVDINLTNLKHFHFKILHIKRFISQTINLLGQTRKNREKCTIHCTTQSGYENTMEKKKTCYQFTNFLHKTKTNRAAVGVLGYGENQQM